MSNPFDKLSKSSLFLAEVVSVYPTRIETSEGITHEAGTIDVVPRTIHAGVRGVRPIVLGAVSMYRKSAGFSWLPSPGTWVICGYLEEYPDYLICFGAIYNPMFNNLPDSDSPLQLEDCILQHETGSFFRFRNLDTVDNNGNPVSPSKTLRGRSEFMIEHINGDYIEMTEPTKGQTEISIKHHSKATVVIDVDGNIILTPAPNKEVKLGDSSASAEGVSLGTSLWAWLNSHTHMSGVGPTSVALNNPSPAPSSIVKVV